MENILPLILLIPLVALLITQFFSNKDEKAIYVNALTAVVAILTMLLGITVVWVLDAFPTLVYEGPTLYRSKETEFGIDLFMDIYSYIYVLVSTAITMLIIRFSRSYIHRERGYKRFFSNILFFYFGLMTILLAGSLEMLFIGWEVLGVTSFFLIGFYRERYLPVKNALKVISVYRVADIALLGGIWICHHYFGHSIKFASLTGLQGTDQPHILNEAFYQYMIPAVFILAAMVKSGQLPFSSWVPRAMEGPTTSSAIFYGSLSIHIGVYLLIRTSPFWEENLVMHWVIGSVGLLTTIVATLIARVQPSIKTQIGYSSVAQIGLMFIWVSMGWYTLAMVHFACNAFLRAYQLLVSPSILSYRIHDQFFHFEKPVFLQSNGLKARLKATSYMLGIKEFGLDRFMYKFLWQPMKKVGKLLDPLDVRSTYIVVLPLFLMGLYGVFNKELIPVYVLRFVPEFFALIALLFALKAFVERKSALNAWVLVMVNQLFQSLTFSFNDEFDMAQVSIFLSGIFLSTLIGIYCINKLKSSKENVTLNAFHGHSYEHPRLAFLFAVACLGLVGFPITPTFIGEDIMLGHIHENQFLLLGLIVLNIIVVGLVIFRIYSRLFLGQHKKGYHEVSYRSS